MNIDSLPNEHLIHWNYFLSIEKDLEKVGRYVEICEQNFNTYSIELARVLLSACSEIDVLMKQLCKILGLNSVQNINDYRLAIKPNLAGLIDEEVFLPRFGVEFKPWASWENNVTPEWWQNHNSVKHNRNESFHEANLKNTLYSIGGLFVLTLYFYKKSIESTTERIIEFREITRYLNPGTRLMNLQRSYYYRNLIV